MSITREINAILKAKCNEDGFKKNKFLFTRKTDIDFFEDLLSFHNYSWTKEIAIGVFVGIRHATIEKLFTQFTKAELQHPYFLFLENLGYLGPEKYFKQWRISRDENDEYLKHIANDIFEEIRSYAYPFFKKYEDIHQLIEVFEGRDHHPGTGGDTQFYNLPLLYLVSNQKDKGIEFLNRKIQEGYVRFDFQRAFTTNYLNYDDTSV